MKNQVVRNPIKSSIFDFSPNITKGKYFCHKYYVVNNHYAWHTKHQRRPTVIDKKPPLSEVQNNVSIRVNYFCIILEVTVWDREIQRLPTTIMNIFPSLERFIAVVFIYDQDSQIHTLVRTQEFACVNFIFFCS